MPASTVTVTTACGAKTSMQLLAYDGADTVSAHQLAVRHHLLGPADDPDRPRRHPRQRRDLLLGRQVQRHRAGHCPAEVTETRQSVGSGDGRIIAALADTTGSVPDRRWSHRHLRLRQPPRHHRGRSWCPPPQAHRRTPRRRRPSPPTAPHSPARSTPAASTDADGTIVSYTGTFGDGTSASGRHCQGPTVQPAPTRCHSPSPTTTAPPPPRPGRSPWSSHLAPARDAFRAATGTNGNSLLPDRDRPGVGPGR